MSANPWDKERGRQVGPGLRQREGEEAPAWPGLGWPGLGWPGLGWPGYRHT